MRSIAFRSDCNKIRELPKLPADEHFVWDLLWQGHQSLT
jgi:hypothetical protein